MKIKKVTGEASNLRKNLDLFLAFHVLEIWTVSEILKG